MKTLTNGQEVVATISQVRIGKEDMVFNSTVIETTPDGVYVDHPELQGEDTLFIDLRYPMNSVVAKTVDVERNASKRIEMKDAKKAIQKAFLYEEDGIALSVKIYNLYEDAEQTYDVEIQWAVSEDTYTDCIVTDVYNSNVEGDDVSLKEATKRATAVLRTVKDWFKHDDKVTVTNKIEVYGN